MLAIDSLGFGTFGSSCKSLVLKHYATNDPLVSVSRIAVALSFLVSYPLAFVGVCDGLLDFLHVKHRSNALLNQMTVGLLTMITCLAYFSRDLRKLLALNGETWGNAVIYLMPTYMLWSCSKTIKPELKSEVPWVVVTGILGLSMGIIGAVIAMKS